MHTKYLFPHRYKIAGWVLLAISITFGLYWKLNENSTFLTNIPVFYLYDDGSFFGKPAEFPGIKLDDVREEVFIVLYVAGAMLTGFSRLSTEDEFTIQLRLESLLWSMYVVHFAFLLMMIFIYGNIVMDLLYYGFLCFFILFILRFYFVLYKAKQGFV